MKREASGNIGLDKVGTFMFKLTSMSACVGYYKMLHTHTHIKCSTHTHTHNAAHTHTKCSIHTHT